MCVFTVDVIVHLFLLYSQIFALIYGIAKRKNGADPGKGNRSLGVHPGAYTVERIGQKNALILGLPGNSNFKFREIPNHFKVNNIL